MKRRFGTGLIVGKFAPLHHGHELLINRALAECKDVVVISYSKPEFPGCEVDRREKWLLELFPSVRTLVLDDERFRKLAPPNSPWNTLPDNGAPDTVHRQFVGFLCQFVLRTQVHAVFTSEDYGHGFAEELTACLRGWDPEAERVVHVMVDAARQAVPTSGTAIREKIHRMRRWLSPAVYASFVSRVCLLGGESTGKSTLAEALAETFGTLHVAEYGRELWELKQGKLEFEDLLLIAKTQVEREERALRQAHHYLFCDTSPLTTLFYSDFLFQKHDPELARMARRRYHLTVLCMPDFPFTQDGTRQPAAFREMQHAWYLQELRNRRIDFIQVQGSIADRIGAVSAALKNLEE